MIRRQARERRDYIYRRALQLRDASIAEKRALLKKSLATGKPLDPSVANDKSLRKDFKYDESLDPETAAAQESIDDEYAMLSGLADPRPLVTTSRSPSTRLSTFSKEIRLLLPTSSLFVRVSDKDGLVNMVTVWNKDCSYFETCNRELRDDKPGVRTYLVSLSREAIKYSRTSRTKEKNTFITNGDQSCLASRCRWKKGQQPFETRRISIDRTR